MDYITEPENKLIRYGPEVVQEIRKENNLDKKERREEAIAIIEEWVKTQDHIVKKKYRDKNIASSEDNSKLMAGTEDFYIKANNTEMWTKITTQWSPETARQQNSGRRCRPQKKWRDKLDTFGKDWSSLAQNRTVWNSRDFAQLWDMTGKGYLERCIITSKGSLERTKLQIDKMCTLRTLMPKYFQITNLLESDMNILDKGYFAFVPTLTKEYHRVIIIKVKPNADMKSADYTLLFKFFVIVAEYLKSNDYCRGFTLINDIFDASAADILSKINLVELQQFIPVITEGYGTKIKGIIFVTGSKFIDGFVRIVKPFFSEKIASRIHVTTTKKGVQEFIPEDILPEEYGGKGEPLEVLHKRLIESLSSKSHQELLKEMNQANTDESRRQRDKFNEKYMGMPGSFRSFSLD